MKPNEQHVEKNPEYLAKARGFQGQADPFPASLFKVGSIDHVTWWKGLKNAALPGLVELMI